MSLDQGGGPGRLVGPLRLLDGITRAGGVLAAAALAGIVVAFCWEVAARYFFTAPTEWAHDTVTYLLAVVVFLGLPELTRQRGNIAITFLVEMLGDSGQRRAARLASATGALVCLAAGWMSWTQTAKQFERGIVTLGTIPIPKWWISAVITWGLLLAALHFLRHAAARER